MQETLLRAWRHIAETVTFHDPALFPAFGLPAAVPGRWSAEPGGEG